MGDVEVEDVTAEVEGAVEVGVGAAIDVEAGFARLDTRALSDDNQKVDIGGNRKWIPETEDFVVLLLSENKCLGFCLGVLDNSALSFTDKNTEVSGLAA